MAATASLVKRVGALVAKSSENKPSGWFTPHMAAASRAIADRLPLVDIICEIRDARIPLSSEYEQLRYLQLLPRRIIVLNKIDLANPMQIKNSMKYFNQQNCITFGVNSHNEYSIKEFLQFLRVQVQRLNKTDPFATIMLVGIPNVGKSALAGTLHHLGRFKADEKGKKKYATVSQMPGETKNIRALKMGSNPNIYVLDTPGVLPPQIPDVELCFKLILTGAIRDCMIEEKDVAQYFLAILNSSHEYKKWENLPTVVNKLDTYGSSDQAIRRKKKYLSDHTQDFIVNRVRQALYETISSSEGNMIDEEDFGRLMEAQFIALQEAFYLPVEPSDDNRRVTATKLLDLYRNGMLGHYTLDRNPMIA